MGVQIRVHRHLILSGTPGSAIGCLRVGAELLRLMPELLRPRGLVVLAVRGAELEPWEVRGLGPGPYVDDLIRAIAVHGRQPAAVIVPSAYVVRDAGGRRTGGGVRVLAECRGRRASLELRLEAGGAAAPVVARDLGPAPDPAWIGCSPPAWLRLESADEAARPGDPSRLN